MLSNMATEEAIIHNTVHSLRTSSGVTQEDLALAVGVTRQTIISIEKGNYTPSVLLALKLAQYFGVSVEEVFSITYE
jgi:putative transcriptional regulator